MDNQIRPSVTFGSFTGSITPTSYKVVPAAKPVEANPDQHDVVIIAPPAKDAPQGVLNVRVPLSAENLTPDPVTGELPVELVVVKKDPKLGNLPPAYIGDPTLEKPAPEGQVNVTAAVPIPIADFEAGNYTNWESTLIRPGQQVIDTKTAQAIPTWQKGQIDTSQVGIKMPAFLANRGLETLSYQQIQTGATVTANLAGTIAGMSMVLTHAAGGWAAYTGLGAGLLGAYGGLEQLKIGESNRAAMHKNAEASGLTELPLAVNPANGKMQDAGLSTSVKDLDANFDASRRTAYGKLLAGGLIAAAGGASLAGSPVAPFLALGALASGAAFSVTNTKNSIQQISAKEKELKALKADGKTTTLTEVPVNDFVRDQDGNVQTNAKGQPLTQQVGSRKVEVPIENKLTELAAEKAKLFQTAPQSVLSLGVVPAVTLFSGLPFMTVSLGAGAVGMAANSLRMGSQMYQLHKQKAEFQAAKADGQKTVKMCLPQFDEVKNITGSKEIELPVDSQIANLDAQINGLAVQTGMFGAMSVGFGAFAATHSMAMVPGALAVPAGIYAYRQISGIADLAKEKKELVKLKDAGETNYKIPQLIGDSLGNVTGFQEVEAPIDARLKEIDRGMRTGGFKTTAALTVGAASVACVAGAPIMLVAGAGIATVALAAGATNLPEMKDFAVKVGQSIASAIGNVGQWIADQFHKLFGGGDAANKDLSPAMQDLFALQKDLSKVDKGAAKSLFENVKTLATTQDPEERKAAQAQYDQAFATLKEKAPDTIAKWPDAVQALQTEAATAISQQAGADKLQDLQPKAAAFRASFSPADHQAIDDVVKGPGQAVIDDPGVKSMADSLGISRDDLTDLSRVMIRRNLKGDETEIQELAAKAQAGDKHSENLLEMLPALQAAANGQHAKETGGVDPSAQAQQIAAQLPQLQANSDHFVSSLTDEDRANVQTVLTTAPLVQHSLAAFHELDGPTQLGITPEELGDISKIWVTAAVKGDPSQISLIAAKAQLGDAQAAKQLNVLQSLENISVQLQQQAQQQEQPSAV